MPPALWDWSIGKVNVLLEYVVLLGVHRILSFLVMTDACFDSPRNLSWVAVKELKLSYYIGETLLFTMYTHYGKIM